MKKNIREIIFDTETTGLYPGNGDRLVEIGCIEIIDYVKTGRTFHVYINPERDISDEAYQVHKLSTEFLSTKPVFKDIADDFLDFIGEDSNLVAHNAVFDIAFINMELARIGKPKIDQARVVDTLKISRKKFPKQRKHSLDALCKKYNINNAIRSVEGHGALLDSELLLQVYVKLLDIKPPGFFDDMEEEKQEEISKKVEIKIEPEPVLDKKDDEKIKFEFENREVKFNLAELELHEEVRKSFNKKPAIWNKYS